MCHSLSWHVNQSINQSFDQFIVTFNQQHNQKMLHASFLKFLHFSVPPPFHLFFTPTPSHSFSASGGIQTGILLHHETL